MVIPDIRQLPSNQHHSSLRFHQLLGNFCRSLFMASLPSLSTLILNDACSYRSWKDRVLERFLLTLTIKKSLLYQNIPLKLLHPKWGRFLSIEKGQLDFLGHLNQPQRSSQSSCQVSKRKKS